MAQRAGVCLLWIALACAVVSAQQQEFASQHIEVRNVTITGLSQVPPHEQSHIAGEVQKQTYNEYSWSKASVAVRRCLQDLGYYRATAGDPMVTVVSSTPENKIVDLAIPAQEGPQYRLKEIRFLNNGVFSAPQLRAAFPIGDGEVAKMSKVRDGLERLRKLYAGRGYINFAAVPEVLVDVPATTLTLLVDAQEGAQFRLGTFTLDGPEPVPGAAAKLAIGWKKYQGKIFTDQAIADFFRENAAWLPPHLLPQTLKWQLTDIQQDPDNHVVNFRLKLPQTAAQK